MSFWKKKKEVEKKPLTYRIGRISSETLLSLGKEGLHSLIEEKFLERDNLKIKIISSTSRLVIDRSIYDDMDDEIDLVVDIEEYEYI